MTTEEKPESEHAPRSRSSRRRWALRGRTSRYLLLELAIVATGVLIALGAEQIVGWMHRQTEIRTFQSAIDNELAENLASFQYRIAQDECVTSRLMELRALRDQALAGATVGVGGEIGRPSLGAPRTSVWDARDPAVMSAMPLHLRLAYSEVYDGFDSNFDLIAQEREAWRSMARFNALPKLTGEDARQLSELIFRADSIAQVLRPNFLELEKLTSRLKIRPDERLKGVLGAPDPAFCRPLSAPPSDSAERG